MTLPDSLAAAPPGWFIDADVVVVGSGIAGLTTAIRATRAGRKVVVVTKSHVDEGSTRWAQGGIAAALGTEDSPTSTCRTRWSPGPDCAIRPPCGYWWNPGRRLYAGSSVGGPSSIGPRTVTSRREGGHLTDRIAHAGGDATGAEILRALVSEVGQRIQVIEHALVLDLLLDRTPAPPRG